MKRRYERSGEEQGACLCVIGKVIEEVQGEAEMEGIQSVSLWHHIYIQLVSLFISIFYSQFPSVCVD